MTPQYPRPGRPLEGPFAWRGEQFARSDEWCHLWTPTEIAELEAALARVQASRTPIERIGPTEFPLETLTSRLDRLREGLLRGRGFVLLRGLDVDRYSREEIATIFWGIGAHLGRAVPQNARGHLLGHVKDLGRDAADPHVRIYETRERQGYHTDSADIVGLLCLEQAREGGRSSLVSCAAIHNELFETAPELLDLLFEPFSTDHRGEHRPDVDPFFTAPILSWYADELSVLYQRHYIESAQRFDGVPRLTDARVAALDAFDAVADDPAVHLEMDLQRGDIQFIHNHQMLHDRTAFRDGVDESRRRHLLRLWLCPEDGRPLPPWFAARLGSVEPGRRGGVPLAGVEPVVPLRP